MKDKIKEDLYNNRIAICFVSIYLFVMQLAFSSLCPVKVLFNIDCPGCGLTHATIYMLKGQFIDAFNANYTVFLWWGFIILFVIDRYVHKLKIKVFPNLLIIVTSVTLIRYFVNIFENFKLYII